MSPLVAAKALRGPLAALLTSLGHDASPLSLAELYRDIVHGFVLDDEDSALASEIEALGLRVLVTRTVMRARGPTPAGRAHAGVRARDGWVRWASGRLALTLLSLFSRNANDSANGRRSVATAAYAMGREGPAWTAQLVARGYQAMTILADQTVLSTPAFLRSPDDPVLAHSVLHAPACQHDRFPMYSSCVLHLSYLRLEIGGYPRRLMARHSADGRDDHDSALSVRIIRIDL